MKRRVTIRDVATAAGVHPSTVSRALDPSNRRLVREDIALRIEHVSKTLGYRPNSAAHSLRTNRSHTIGVVVPDITNPIFPPIIRGIEDVLAAVGYVAILGNTDGNKERASKIVENLIDRGVDGLILASVEKEDKTVSSVLSAGIPMVTANRHSDDPSVCSVTHDETEGMRRILIHLASLGHHNIAYIGGPQTLSTGAERYAAFERYRNDLQLNPGGELIVFARAYGEVEGERCAEELLACGGRFTAIVCANDRLAVGAIAALRRRQIRCPEDISVTGYNDMPMMDQIQPPLTTIRTHQYRLGAEAATVLHSLIEGRDTGKHKVLPVELVIRGSTCPARGGREDGSQLQL